MNLNSSVRFLLLFFVPAGVVLGFANCTPFGQKPSIIECGPGYVYNQEASACFPEAGICNPKCNSDEKCIDNKCVPRLEPDPPVTLECAVTCGDNEICEKGQCVPAPCNPPCQSGFTCSNGICSPTAECNPPCLQTGYVCVNGLCEAICPKNCADQPGTECIRGVCQKPCKPDCQSGFFCNDGKCQKLEDADGDGYRSDRDCDDKVKTTNPGAVELCDNVDNDCDGQVDNMAPQSCYDGASGTLGVGPCKAGSRFCEKGKWGTCTNEVVPAAKEDCSNNIDDDCNGTINDGCP